MDQHASVGMAHRQGSRLECPAGFVCKWTPIRSPALSHLPASLASPLPSA